MRCERTAMAVAAVLLCGTLAGCGVFGAPVQKDNACGWMSDGTGVDDDAPPASFLAGPVKLDSGRRWERSA